MSKRGHPKRSCQIKQDDEPIDSVATKSNTRWHLLCETEEDWKTFAEKFRKSKAKCERDLYRVIVQDFLPESANLITEKVFILDKNPEHGDYFILNYFTNCRVDSNCHKILVYNRSC